MNLQELAKLMSDHVYQSVPLPDFQGNDLVFIKPLCHAPPSALKKVLQHQGSQNSYSLAAMDEEIASTLTIEHIDFSRESVRRIMRGYAPADESEERIYGLKKGLDFIANRHHTITEENINKLYRMAIGQYLTPRENQLLPDRFYRHDSVFIVSLDVEHIGLPAEKLPGHMYKLIQFIQKEDDLDDLLKAAIIHFYLAYIHPYFDGNGRMARLLHLWFLIQRGYPSTLFIPVSSYIERSRRKYDEAFTLVEQNAKFSGLIDVTPFLLYFIENVYALFSSYQQEDKTLNHFNQVLKNGDLTGKEHELWTFILVTYGQQSFSTKQLERDYGQAAYATIRSFVLKLTALGLLDEQRYKNRRKYRIRFE